MVLLPSSVRNFQGMLAPHLASAKTHSLDKSNQKQLNSSSLSVTSTETPAVPEPEPVMRRGGGKKPKKDVSVSFKQDEEEEQQSREEDMMANGCSEEKHESEEVSIHDKANGNNAQL